MTDFGAFVELAPGIDALLHVSQISREHVAKPSDVLSIGQVITAKVVDFNGEDKKISLSMKALEAPAAAAPLKKQRKKLQKRLRLRNNPDRIKFEDTIYTVSSFFVLATSQSPGSPETLATAYNPETCLFWHFR